MPQVTPYRNKLWKRNSGFHGKGTAKLQFTHWVSRHLKRDRENTYKVIKVMQKRQD